MEGQSQVTVFQNDGEVHGDELGAVGKRALNLNLRNHVGHALHHLAAAQQLAPQLHEVRNAPPLADKFEELGPDQADRLGIVQPQSAGEAPLGEGAHLVQHQLVQISWC